MADSLPLVSETYDEEEGGITGDSYGSFKNPVLISDSSDELTPTGSFSSMDPNKMARISYIDADFSYQKRKRTRSKS